MRFDLLRHGETTLGHTLRGSIDDDLTVKGLQQMQGAVEQFEQPLWDVVISSPLKRCSGFAQNMALTLNCPYWVNAGLKEMHFGAWEGQSTKDLYAQYPEQLSAFWQTPTCYTPPQAESLAHFHARVINAITSILQQMQEQQLKHALIVTHGGVIKLLKTIALQEPLDNLLTMSAELGTVVRFQHIHSHEKPLHKAQFNKNQCHQDQTYTFQWMDAP